MIRFGALAASSAMMIVAVGPAGLAAASTPTPSPPPSPVVQQSPSPTPSPVRAYDLVAIGADIRARVGSTAQITVGVKNTGPGTSTGSGGALGPKHSYLVTLPAGAELVKPHIDICPPLRLTPVPGEVSCILHEVAPGASRLATIDLRITAPITTEGTVARIYQGSNYPPIPDYDTNNANDVAVIRISTDELPQTGSGTGLIAALGGGAVAMGLLLVVAASRRLNRRRV